MLSKVLRHVVLPTVTAFALVLPLVSPAVAAGVSIFIDKNDNGVFDAGVDVDVSETLKTTGVVETTDSIVVPEGAVVRLSLDSASLRADKAIHVAGTIYSSGALFFRTETGPITVAPRSNVIAYTTLQMTAGSDLVIDNARLRSYDVTMLESLGGQIQVNKGILYGVNRLELNGYAAAGGLTVVGTTMQAPRGLINLHLEGTADLQQARLQAVDVYMVVKGGYAELSYSIVRVAARTGVVIVSVEAPESSGLAASGSYLDVTKTKFYAAPGNVVMSADQMVGY
jgi:hypothetical protein